MRIKQKKIFYNLALVFLIIFLTINLAPKLSSSTTLNISYSHPNIQWTTANVISNESSLRSLRPVIAVDINDNVHFVWQDRTDLENSGLDEDLFHRFWNQTSKQWSPVTVVSPAGSQNAKMPMLEADDKGNVHLIWYDYTNLGGAGDDSDIFYRFWNHTTSQWSTIEIVSQHSTSNVYWADITAENGLVYAVWQDSTNYLSNGADEDILFAERLLNGTWTEAITISTEGSSTSSFPCIEIDSSANIYIAWDDEVNYNNSGLDRDILLRYRNSTTKQWSDTQLISSSSNSFSEHSEMAIDNLDNLHLIWVDGSNIQNAGLDHDILYRRLNYKTNNLGEITLVTEKSNSDSDFPDIITDSKNDAYLVWFDISDLGYGTDRDIFYRHLNTSLNTWSEYTIVSSDSTGNSWRPKVSIDSNNTLHLVWQDETSNYANSGNDIDIFYSQGAIPIPKPSLTFTKKPLDNIEVTNKENITLSWILSDANVSSPSFSLLIDDVEVLTGKWTTDRIIEYSTNFLDIGNYSVIFTAEDGLGESLSDDISIIVSRDKGLNSFGMFLIGSSIAIGIVISTASTIIIIKKKKTTNQNQMIEET